MAIPASCAAWIIVALSRVNFLAVNGQLFAMVWFYLPSMLRYLGAALSDIHRPITARFTNEMGMRYFQHMPMS